MECVISALHLKYNMAMLDKDIDKAQEYSNLEAYFQSKLNDCFSVYE